MVFSALSQERVQQLVVTVEVFNVLLVELQGPFPGQVNEVPKIIGRVPAARHAPRAAGGGAVGERASALLRRVRFVDGGGEFLGTDQRR